MRFLKLLDPNDLPGDDISAPGKQQRMAAKNFPRFVESSRLNYWKPGDPIYFNGKRFLVGLAAFFDLKDLRLADIINEALENHSDIRVDVFDIATECPDNSSQISAYFPGFDCNSYFSTPIVGLWDNGIHKQTHIGYEARQFILDGVRANMTAEESVANLCPPDRSLFEG